MPLQDIYDKLNAALQQGVIALSSATVPNLDLTLQAYGIGDTESLTFTGAELSLMASSVVLSGNATYRGFNWVATLTGEAVNPNSPDNRFTLILRGVDRAVKWSIGTSFPNLPQSRRKENPGALALGPSVLAPLLVDQPTFSVTTEPGGTEPAKPRLQGWLLLGSSELAIYVSYLGASQLRIDGEVDFLVPTSPILQLTAVASSANRDFKVVPASEVGLLLRSSTPDIYALDESAIVSMAALYAKIRVGSSSPLYVTLTAPLLYGDAVWPLTAQLDPPLTVTTGLSLVLEFFGLPPNSASLISFPMAKSLLDSFGLTGVEVGIQPPLNGRFLDLKYASVQFKATDAGLSWIPALPFVRVTEVGTGWVYHWYGNAEFVTGNIWGKLSFFDDPELEIPGDTSPGSRSSIQLKLTATIPDFVMTAENEGDIRVPVGAVLKKYLGGSGGVPDTLTITRVLLQAIPPEQSYQASLMVDGIWATTVNRVTMSLDRVIGEIMVTQNRVYGSLSCFLGLVVTNGGVPTTKASFLVTAVYRQDGTWLFEGGLADGELSLTDFAFGLLGIPPSVDLPSVDLVDLWLTYETALEGSSNPYSARGALELRWNPEVLGLHLSLRAEASIARRPAANAADRSMMAASPVRGDGDMIYEGSVSGALKINGLLMVVGLSFVDTQTVYFFKVVFGGLTLLATTRWIDDEPASDGVKTGSSLTGTQHQILVITLSGYTLGGVVEALVNLANPNLNYHLDAPWSFLNSIDLSRFELQIDPSAKQSITLTYAIDLSLPFIHVETVGIQYDRSRGEPAVRFILTGNFLGKTYSPGNPLSWDAVNDPPPQVPGEGLQLVDLRYLGVGQHITLGDMTKFDSVADVLAALVQEMQPAENPTDNPLAGSGMRFDPASQWFIGLDCTLMETVSIGIILHDPDLYGLLVSLAGPEAGALAGLSFELLYKKVTDTVGVFRVQLQVPPAFRQINIGPVALTLGVVTVDIFTNGNFMVDFGFPHNRDFSVSFGLQAGPFIGSGGLYFGLLDGATSRRVPAITNGAFDPVIELGLGIAVGLGRTFEMGPLKAGLYVEMVAIFEGVLAWFHPSDHAAPSAMYYWAQAMAGLVGKLYGSVDFKVIKVAISVEARASVALTFAAYSKTLVEMNVGVEVNAEIKILFIKISFTFSLQLAASFVIGVDSAPPWSLADGQTDGSNARRISNLAPARRRRPFDVRALTRQLHLAARHNLNALPLRHVRDFTGYNLHWRKDITVFPDGAVHPVTVKMLPVYTIDQPPVAWSEMQVASSSNQYRIAFLLMADTGVDPAATTIAQARLHSADRSATATAGGDTAFNVLLEGMLRWSISALGLDPVQGHITAGQLEELQRQLNMPDAAAALDLAILGNFFGKNLEFRISGVPAGSPAATGGAIFPMPPPLGWDSTEPPPDSNQRRFQTYQPIDATYEQEISRYFEQTFPTSPATAADSVPADAATDSMAAFVFRDYFLMVAKAAVEAAVSQMASFPYAFAAPAQLAAICAQFPTVTAPYTKCSGDTVEEVAQFYGYSGGEILALNPDLSVRLQAAQPGSDVAVLLGVTPESLAAANPSWPIVAGLPIALGDLDYQILSGSTLSAIALSLGADVTAWLALPALLDAPRLLRLGASLAIPTSSYVNTQNLPLKLVAALFFVRLLGTDHRGLLDDPALPLVEWYGQAIAQLNSIGKGALPASLLIPTAFDQLQAPLTWTTLPGDTLWSVAATFAVDQNSVGNHAFEVWLSALQSLNPSTGPIARILLPAMTTVVLPNETLRAISLRLPIELPDPAHPDGYLDQTASFGVMVRDADILQPGLPLAVPDCNVTTQNGQSLSSFAQRYNLSLEDVGRRLAGVTGLLAPSGADDFQVPHPPAVTIGSSNAQPVAADLVPTVVRVSGSAISGQVSRFLLHGLRMPSPQIDEEGHYHATGPKTGLYDLIGQQLIAPAPPSARPPQPTVVLKLTVKVFDSTATWIKLYDSAAMEAGASITETIHSLNPGLRLRSSVAGIVALTAEVSELTFNITDADLYDNYPATALEPIFEAPPAPSPVYFDAPVRHGLQQHIAWQSTESIALPNPGQMTPPLSVSPGLWLFDDDLMASAGKLPANDFQMWSVSSQLGPSASPTEVSLYAWTTVIDITIQQIGGMPNTYDVSGADTAGRQELLEIVQYLQANLETDSATVRVLYQESAGAGVPAGLSSASVDPALAYLIKSNLSTDTRSSNRPGARSEDPPVSSEFYAPLSDAAGFLMLLWECSVSGGRGYWLHYPGTDGSGFPGAIFADNGSATVSLLITLASQVKATAPARKLRSFNNAALVGDAMENGAVSLFVAASDGAEIIRQATLQPGNIAFGATLSKPFNASIPNGASSQQIALRQLYSLIAYKLEAGPVFSGSDPALPLGPGVLQESAVGPRDENLWELSQVIPIARFALQHNLPRATGLPDPAEDPYRGIGARPGAMTQASILLTFREILGNSSAEEGSASTGGPLRLSLPVGYTDPVVELGAWPNTTLSFRVAPPATGPGARLEVTAALQASMHLPSRRDRARTSAARAFEVLHRFTHIYYQAVQPDIRVTLLTTLETQNGTPRTLEPTGSLRPYAVGACAWLWTVSQLLDIAADTLTYSTLATLSDAYGTGYDELAAANADVPLSQIFAAVSSSENTTAFSLPVFGIFQAGSAVADLCPSGIDPKVALADPFNTTLLLQPAVELAIPARQYTVPTPPAPEETLSLSVIARQNHITLASLVQSNRTAAALLRVGFVFVCEGVEVEISSKYPDVTFDDVALSFQSLGVQFDAIAIVGANSNSSGMLRGGAVLVVNRYLCQAGETLAKNGSGSDVRTLAAENGGTVNLYPAGTPLHLTSESGATLFSDTLRVAARIAGVTPEQLLRFNVDVPLLSSANSLIVPGQSSLPATPASLRIPFSIPSGATFSGIAALFLNADPTGAVSAPLALAQANLEIPGVLAPGQTIPWQGQQVTTIVGDSFASLLSRFNPVPPLSFITDFIGGTPGFLAADALLLTPPAVAPIGQRQSAYSPKAIAERYGISLQSLAVANTSITGIIKSGIDLTFVPPGGSTAPITVTTGPADTLNSLIWRFAQQGAVCTVGALLASNENVAFLRSGALFLLAPQPATLTATVGGGGSWQFPSSIFPLHVWVDIARNTDLVDPSFQGSAAVSARSAVPPVPSASWNGADDGYLKLQQFAADLETALPAIRIATGKVLSEQRKQDVTDLWCIAFGPGFIQSVDIHPGVTVPRSGSPKIPKYYALRPLENVLSSRMGVTIQPLETDCTLGPAVPTDFQGIDLENWARRFVSDVDLFLSAPYASSVYPTAQRECLAAILADKSTLADGISKGLDYVLDFGQPDPSRQSPPPPDWQTARDALRQRMLTTLSEGYGIDALIQYDVEVESPWTETFARLSGAATLPQGTTGDCNHMQISTGKTSLTSTATGDHSYLTFLINVAEEGTQESISLPLSYSINETEFNIRPIAAGYSASDWLSFVLPFNQRLPAELAIDLGTPQIPIPLRYYPFAPSLVAQTAEPTAVAVTSYAETSYWDYAFTFQHQSLAVDHLIIEVTFNKAPVPPMQRTLEGMDLFGALAQYTEVAPKLWSVLQNLPQVSKPTLPTDLANAVETFATLVSTVANCWNTYWTSQPAPPPASATTLLTETYRFTTKLTTVQNSPDLKWSYSGLYLTREQADGSVEWPVMSVILPGMAPQSMGSGVDTPDGRHYVFPSGVPAFSLLRLEMRFTDLHVATYQNASAQISVLRNVRLSTDAPTRNSFVFQTNPIAFPDLATPLLLWRRDFSIDPWSNQASQSPLIQVFQTLFDGNPKDRLISCGIRYGYVIATSDSASITPSLPMKYRPSFAFDNDPDNGTVQQIVTAVNIWINQNIPASNDGKLVFSLTLYSSIPGQLNRPILQIARLVSPITSLAETCKSGS